MSWAVRGEREGGEEVFASQTFHQSSHISDLLPRCAPQLSSPIIKIIPPVIIIVILNMIELHLFSQKLLPVAFEPRGEVEIPCCFFCSLFHFTFCCRIHCIVELQNVCVLFYFWSSCLFVSPNNISRAAVPRPSSLISDYSSNLCKLKPCQMELRGLRVSYLIHIANIFWFKEKGEKNKSVSKQCNQYLFHFKSIQWTVFSKVQHICTWKSSQIFGTFPSQVWSGSKWPHSQETLLSSFTTGHW